MLKRIESDDADRVVELPRHEIGEDGFEVCALDLGFSVNTARRTEAVHHEVDGLIRAEGHDPRPPALPRHPPPLLKKRNENKSGFGEYRPPQTKKGPGRPRAPCRW